MTTDPQPPPQTRPGKRPAHVRAAERLGSILVRVSGRLARGLDALDKEDPGGSRLPGEDWIETAKWASKTAIDIADQHTKRLTLDRKHPPPPMRPDSAREVIAAFIAGLTDDQAEHFRELLDRRGQAEIEPGASDPIDVASEALP